ncbi:hypothetical protein GCM10022243_10680 [Saccharothrix violaceirubra]
MVVHAAGADRFGELLDGRYTLHALSRSHGQFYYGVLGEDQVEAVGVLVVEDVREEGADLVDLGDLGLRRRRVRGAQDATCWMMPRRSGRTL